MIDKTIDLSHHACTAQVRGCVPPQPAPVSAAPRSGKTPSGLMYRYLLKQGINQNRTASA